MSAGAGEISPGGADSKARPLQTGATPMLSWSEGVLNPRSFVARLASGQAQVLWLMPVGAYLLSILILTREVFFRSAFLWRIAPGSTWRRTSEAVLQHTRDDVYLWCGIWAIFWVAGRWLFPGPLSTRRRLMLLSALFWPLAMGKFIGAGLSLAGADLWWLPHHPVRSWVIVEQGQVIWWRYGVKCFTSYALSASMLLLLFWELWWGMAAQKSELTQSETRASGLFSEKMQLGNGRKRAVRIVQGTSVALMLGTFFVAGWDLRGAASRLRPLLPGDPFPARDLPLLIPEKNRRSIAAEELHGKILVLDFWASWCLPCRRSIPEISEGLAQAYPEQVVVLGVNQDRDRKAAREMWQSLDPAFESAVDPGSWGHRLGITSLPTTLVVDARGILRHVHIGFTEIGVLQRNISALLSDTSP